MPFPIFQAAVNETVEEIQAPTKMVHHCGINAVFSAVQGLGDFQRPDGGTVPLSNISLIIGESGERKSAVDRCFFREIYNLRESTTDASVQSNAEHYVRMKTWTIEQKLLERQLKTAICSNTPDREHLIDALIQHELRKPKRSKKITFVYEDTSLASLKRGLENFPIACVHSSEGMSILNGPLFGEKSLLCTLYSGDTYFFDRAGRGVALRDRRLCVSAHSQPLRTLGLLAKMGDELRNSGLASRMTVCLLKSTQGLRRHDGIQIPTTHREVFNDRVRYLLKLSVRAASRAFFLRRKIRFCPSATREYLEYSNWIEREMRQGGKFACARDYANRLAEKVGRLAAAMHLFENFEGDIALDTYMAARSIYDEECADFLYLFNYVPSEHYLAEKLWHWLQHQSPMPGEPGLRKSYIEQRCHMNLRRKAALDPALALLQEQGMVQMKTINRAIYVCPGFRTTGDNLSAPRILSI